MISCINCRNAIIEYNSIKCGSFNEEYKAIFKRYKTDAPNKGCLGYKRILIGTNKQITLDRALRFVLAGRAEFKIVSGKTKKELHYRILKKDKAESIVYWIYGSEYDNNLLFLGTIYFNIEYKRFNFSRGLSGNSSNQDILVKSILYLLNNLLYHKYNINIQLFHKGNCGRCGKMLTETKSIIVGLDNTCDNRVYNPDWNKLLNI